MEGKHIDYLRIFDFDYRITIKNGLVLIEDKTDLTPWQHVDEFIAKDPSNYHVEVIARIAKYWHDDVYGDAS